MKVGQQIKFLREQRGFNQGQLAEQAGLAQAYVSQLERGQREPSMETLESIAKVLDISVSALLAIDVESASGRKSKAQFGTNLSKSDYSIGLHDLAVDSALRLALNVTDEDLETLSALPVEGITKAGYVQLLYTIRAVTPKNRVTRS